MMMKTTLAISILLSCIFSFAAYSSAQDDGVQYESETTYDFDDDIVEGQLVRPDGELIGGQRHGKESALINIRADFIPEMVQSVEEM